VESGGKLTLPYRVEDFTGSNASHPYRGAVYVRAVSGGVRAASFFVRTPASREALDHRLIFPYGLRRTKGPTFRAAEGGARSFPSIAMVLKPTRFHPPIFRAEGDGLVRCGGEMSCSLAVRGKSPPGPASGHSSARSAGCDATALSSPAKGEARCVDRGVIEYLGDSVDGDGSGRRPQPGFHRPRSRRLSTGSAALFTVIATAINRISGAIHRDSDRYQPHQRRYQP
jgi:hypothetical protein